MFRWHWNTGWYSGGQIQMKTWMPYKQSTAHVYFRTHRNTHAEIPSEFLLREYQALGYIIAAHQGHI